MVGVSDRREVPEEHSAVINTAMNEKMRAALHKVWGEPGLALAVGAGPVGAGRRL
ncbi:hypothetical protein [Streptomyces sp. NPDC050485]|uniref:hypothetical protein n=1 Tax=Streptomyces sp. NPDC050485 TaxID=3365617 RepID=UPI00378FDDAF